MTGGVRQDLMAGSRNQGGTAKIKSTFLTVKIMNPQTCTLGVHYFTQGLRLAHNDASL